MKAGDENDEQARKVVGAEKTPGLDFHSKEESIQAIFNEGPINVIY